jgi:hypothetical protein
MGDLNKFSKKILAALDGVEPFDPDKHKNLPQEPTRLLIYQKEPVSRFLKLALVELHGRKLYTGDKIEWKAYVVFKGSVWYIHDWKHAAWTLYGPANAEAAMKLLLKKLEAAPKSQSRAWKQSQRQKSQAVILLSLISF